MFLEASLDMPVTLERAEIRERRQRLVVLYFLPAFLSLNFIPL